jgi:hypothetical protein
MVTFILFSPVAPLLAAVLVGGCFAGSADFRIGVGPEIENSSLHFSLRRRGGGVEELLAVDLICVDRLLTLW